MLLKRMSLGMLDITEHAISCCLPISEKFKILNETQERYEV